MGREIPRIIAFEGIDGSGKTTQVERFKDNVERRGYTTEVYSEPGGTTVANTVKDLVLDPEQDIDDDAEFALFWASHYDVFNTIMETDADLIILDRGPMSTWAYQVHGRHHGDKTMRSLYRSLAQRLPQYMTYYLDVSVKTGMRRNEPEDRIDAETKAFYDRVKTGYDNPPTTNIRRFDGEQQADSLETSIIETFKANHET